MALGSQRQADFCEFEASPRYMMSSRTAKAIERDPTPIPPPEEVKENNDNKNQPVNQIKQNTIQWDKKTRLCFFICEFREKIWNRLPTWV